MYYLSNIPYGFYFESKYHPKLLKQDAHDADDDTARLREPWTGMGWGLWMWIRAGLTFTPRQVHLKKHWDRPGREKVKKENQIGISGSETYDQG